MTEITSEALAESIGWSEAERNDVLEKTVTLFSHNIELIRRMPAPAAKPSIFDDLRAGDVPMTARSGAASMIELFESCD